VIAPRSGLGLAAILGIAGGALGVMAGVIQATLGPRIPDWTGAKADPVALGLLTVMLSLIALGGSITLRAPAGLSASRRLIVAVGLLVPGALCFSTVGRLWFVPGTLLLIAFGLVAVTGGTTELRTVLRANWTRGLVSVLGATEILMAVSAAPITTALIGIAGGCALMAAPWVGGRASIVRIPLLLIGTLPFAALTWWSLASPLVAIVALTMGFTLPDATRAIHRDNPR